MIRNKLCQRLTDICRAGGCLSVKYQQSMYLCSLPLLCVIACVHAFVWPRAQTTVGCAARGPCGLISEHVYHHNASHLCTSNTPAWSDSPLFNLAQLCDLDVQQLSQNHCHKQDNCWVIAVYFSSLSQTEQLHNVEMSSVKLKTRGERKVSTCGLFKIILKKNAWSLFDLMQMVFLPCFKWTS